MFNTKTIFFILLAVFLTGCATPKFALDYTAQNTMELEGQISIKEFDYLPAYETKKEDLIPNTALGEGLMLTEPVRQFFTDAVRKEFRLAGISLKAGNCKLEGEVHQLLIDDLGFTVDFIADVRYVLFDKNDKYLLDSRHLTKIEGASKFVVAELILNNLNEMVSKNIREFMESAVFIQKLDENCL